MKTKLTDATVRNIPAPASGSAITYDAALPGFGVRVTAAGARAFVLNYRTPAGRERRYTIGLATEWQVSAARKHAADLKRRIRDGFDPLAELEQVRAAPTMADLCDRYSAEYLADNSKLRPASVTLYRAVIAEIRAALKHRPVAEVSFSECDALHRKVSARAPYVANRLASVLARMLNLAIKWGWRSDNPARGIERNRELKRQRFLAPAELVRLTDTLAVHPDQQAANIIRMLLLTGARVGEVRAMRWADLDLEAGVWTKPAATTKQKAEHRVPLSGPARMVLVGIEQVGDFVFPGQRPGTHRLDFRGAWRSVCQDAGFVLRVHDLRHSYASILASAGLSLPVIGALLGHTQPGTTARYSHLLDDPLRAATERAGAVVMGGKAADVVELGARP